MNTLEAWLTLWRVPGIGPVLFRRLVTHCGTPDEVLAAPHAALEALGLKPGLADAVHQAKRTGAEADLAWADADGHTIITLEDQQYPARLREIGAPPPILFVNGDAGLLREPQLAIVGSRNPTPGGGETAHAFAGELAARGLGITSGLAEGIDAKAHHGALRAGGITIAVAATGLDRIYPARNRELAHNIAEQGAIISEFPVGSPPKAKHFPRRNRLISGLSLGTLVVEAALRSGSLITARLANEQDREVFAIPGSIHNPHAKGCHALIRQGAKLVETVADILEELADQIDLTDPGPTHEPAGAGASAPDPEYQRLLAHLGHDPASIDRLVERSGLTIDAVSSMLLILELEGHVANAGGMYTRLGG